MARGQDGAALREIRTLYSVGTIAGLTDGQLLERFKASRGEAGELAFAALVERHGPMVVRVCRGILREPSDVDDAFQATFLVLARKKVGMLWVRDSLGPWLHGVACRVAARTRSDSARRKRHEQSASERAGPLAFEEDGYDDLGLVLHEEVERLPDRYRTPVVLCYLQGLTHEQAAQQLGWPLGTVRSRLARGRDRLRDRLERRGVAPSAGLLAMSVAQSRPIVSSMLVHAARMSIAGRPSPTALMLARHVIGIMFVHRLAAAIAIVVFAGLAILGGGVAVRGAGKSGEQQHLGRVAAAKLAPPARARVRSEAERIAERVLKTGSDLFDAKAAKELAASYVEDGEIRLISKVDGRVQESSKSGRLQIEQFYREHFQKVGTIDSENTVEFARFVAPDVLVVHGRFRPNAGEPEVPFVQMRTKQGDDWLLSKLWLFLASKGS